MAAQLSPAWVVRSDVVWPCPVTADLLWTAPELLQGPQGPGRATPKGDIFSVGIILQEVLTRGGRYSILFPTWSGNP